MNLEVITVLKRENEGPKYGIVIRINIKGKAMGLRPNVKENWPNIYWVYGVKEMGEY